MRAFFSFLRRGGGWFGDGEVIVHGTAVEIKINVSRVDGIKWSPIIILMSTSPKFMPKSQANFQFKKSSSLNV